MIQRAKENLHQAFLYNQTQMATGFASLTALQTAARNGYAQTIQIQATAAGTANFASDGWTSGNPFGSAGAAAPGGTTYSSTSTKAAFFRNASPGKTLTLVEGQYTANANVNGAQLICDRLFGVAKTMNSTASEAVSGVATRYQSTTPTDPNWSGGNFVYPWVTSGLPATAHNHTICQYTDDAGNTGVAFPSQGGRASAAIQSVDLAAGQWFMRLADGDVGVKNITQLQLDALVATGGINYVLSHPLYWVIHCGSIDQSNNKNSQAWQSNGINSAMQLVRVFDDACLYAYMPLTNNVNNTFIQLTAVEG